jgi:hypothetical protein
MQAAGITFRSNTDGVGNTISASAEGSSCVIQVNEVDFGARVKVSCVGNPKTAASTKVTSKSSDCDRFASTRASEEPEMAYQ